jgi:hypothetical protein
VWPVVTSCPSGLLFIEAGTWEESGKWKFGVQIRVQRCGAPETVVSETWDTVYSLLMRSVEHRI